MGRARTAPAGEDPIARTEVAIEGEVGDLARRLVDHRRVADAVEGEASQCVAQVAPGVEVPVLAVVHEALRREGAFEGVVPRPAVVHDMHPAAREQRLADGLELARADLAAGGVQDPHAPRHFRGCPDITAEQSAGPVDQRLDVRAEQARVHLLEQLTEREEGPELGLVQPQPGEGVARRGRGRLREPVPARLPIPCDRGVQPVAEILEVALERGARDFELLEKRLDRDHPPLAQQGIDPVEAFGPVHSPASSNLPRLIPLVRSTRLPLRRSAAPDTWDGPGPPMSRDRSLAIRPRSDSEAFGDEAGEPVETAILAQPPG